MRGGVAEGVRRLFANPPARAATRRYAEQLDWDSTTQGQLALFREILACRSARQLGATEAAGARGPHL